MRSFEWLRPTFESIAGRVQSLGGKVLRHEVGARASEARLRAAEKRIGVPLPSELRALFQTFSAKFSLCWQLEGARVRKSDPPSGGLLWGEFSSSLAQVEIISAFAYGWAEDIVEGRSKGEWFKKLLLNWAPDGDFLAFGLEGRIARKPVYVPHDGTRSRYLVVGENLQEFLDRWARTGFLMINCFWQFQDKAVERLSWDAFRKEIDFLGIPTSR